MRKFSIALVILAVGLGGFVGGANWDGLPSASAQIGGTWTYSQVKAASGEVVEIINSNRKRLVQAKQIIDVADSELGGLSAAYGSVGTAIDNAVTANPTNAAYLAMDAQWDELVSEFTTLKAESAVMKAALEAL